MKGGLERFKRGRELYPARKMAFSIWTQNQSIFASDLMDRLRENGFDVGRHTCDTWVGRWKRGNGLAGGRGCGPDGKLLRSARVRGKVAPPTCSGEVISPWEQIIKSVPSIETLAVLVLDGFMAKLNEKDTKTSNLEQALLDTKKALEAMTNDRKEVMRQFNEHLAKEKVGTLTLDQVQHRLIPKL